MYFLWVIGLMGVVVMYIIQSATSIPTQSETNTISTAQEMYVFHIASKRACIDTPGLCPVEMEIPLPNILDNIKPSISSGSAYNNGTFISFATSTGNIVTINNKLNASLTPPINNENIYNISQETSMFIAKIAGYKAISGSYDRVAQTIEGEPGEIASVSRELAGTSLQNKVPIIVTLRTW